MKRIALASVLMVIAAVLISAYRDDPLYWKRRALSSFYSPVSRPASYYEPSEVIEGADGPSSPRVAPDLEHLAAQALETAATYADSQGARALIVGRHVHIAYEKYWGGTTFDTPIDAGRFNAALTAIMVGMAMDDRKLALV